MLAGGPGGVGGGVAVHYLHVGEQPGARVQALDQVVAQQGVLGEAPVERRPQHCRVVDALAREDALAKEIHVGVGHRGGVGVYAHIAGEHTRKAAGRAAAQVDTHAGLQDAVAIAHAARGWVEPGLVERVGQGADQGLANVARQLRVGVQRDHVAHARQHI